MGCQVLQPEMMRSVTAATLLLLCLLGSASAYCSQGSEWMEFNGNCYRWTRSAANWFSAELTCQKFAGGHLVSVSSASENNFLLRLTQCSHSVWIGLVNTDHSLKGQARGYQWWDDTPHNYTALSPMTNDYLDCVVLTGRGTWLNTYCQEGNLYVCEAPAEVTAATRTADYWRSTAESSTLEDATSADIWTTTTPGPWSASPSTPSPPMKCPQDWQLMDSSCYFVSDNRTNYFNAQMSCQAMGASVSSVLTPREHTLLTVALGCNSPTWIGLEKARPCFRQPGKDHCWVWMDRSPLVYVAWAYGQNLEQRDAECVILDGQWKVKNCYAEFGYICKRPTHGVKSGSD